MQDGSLCLYFEKGYYPGLKILSDFCDTIGRGEGTENWILENFCPG